MNAYQRAIELLTPHFAGEKDRQHWLQRAFYPEHKDIITAVDTQGTAADFTSRCAYYLLEQYGDIDGRPALCLLLEAVKSKQGSSKQREFDEVVAALEGRPSHEPEIAEASVTNGKHDVFINYSRSDTNIVQRIKTELEQQSFSCWMDTSDILGGDPWERKIANAIRATGTVVSVVSSHSLESKWVVRELDFAEELEKPIIPILIESVSLPLRLRDLQAIDCIENNYPTGLEQLIQAVKKKSS